MARISSKEFFSKGPVKIVGSDNDNFQMSQRTNDPTFLESLWNNVKTFGSGIKQDLTKRGENIGQGLDREQSGQQTAFETALQTTGNVIGAGNDILSRGIKSLDGMVPDKVKEVLNNPLANPIDYANKQVLQKGTEFAQQQYNQWKEKHPRAAADLEASGNILSVLPWTKGGELAGEAKGAASKLTTEVSGIRQSADSMIDNALGPVKNAVESIPGSLPETISNAAESFGRTIENVKNKAVETVQEANQKAARLRTLPQEEANLIRTGIDEQVTDFIKSASQEDKNAFQQMFNVAKKKSSDLRDNTQPIEVAGKTVLERASYVSDKVKQFGQQLKEVVSQMPKQSIDITDQATEFASLLKEKGIKIGKSGKLINTGTIPSGDMKFYQTMYDLVRPDNKMFAGRVLRTPQKLDAFRQRIFDELDLAKARQEAFSNDVAVTAEQFRSMLMKPLRNLNESYYTISRNYSQAIKPLQEFVKLIGYKGKIEGITQKSLKAGEVASRILGNAADRPLSTITELENTAKQFGLDVKNSVTDQVKFADLLDNLFGTSQTRSVRGQVGRGVNDATMESLGAAKDAATGNISGLGGRALKAILGKTEKEQIKALEEFLKSFTYEKNNP